MLLQINKENILDLRIVVEYDKVAKSYSAYCPEVPGCTSAGDTEKEALENILSSWEKTLETDSENLFVLMGKEGPALAPDFRDANYQGTFFRYQTFSKEDLGACYSITDDFFILTSSYESMTKIIDKLYD